MECSKNDNLQQIGPEVVDEVDDEAFDVRAILILISHDHELAVAERLDGVVLFAVLQTLKQSRY